MIARVKEDLSDRSLQLGDRVEIGRGNIFGVIVEIQGYRVRVKMADGTKRLLVRGQAWYSPSPEALERRMEIIKAGWSEYVLKSRSAYESHCEPPLTVPLVRAGELPAEYGRAV